MKTKNNKSKNRIRLYYMAFILLAEIIMISCYSCKGNKDNKIQWLTAIVERQDISNMVTCTGTLEPISTVDVGTQVSGRVDKIYFDYNSVVSQGELLAELDQTVLLATLSSAKSSMATAKSELEYKEKNYERFKVLYEKQLISSSDYEEALYSYQKAQNDYNVGVSNYQTAETNLGYAKIYSPINGVILSREVEEGQTVAASFETPTLFTIANDLTKMRVIAKVDEADMGDIAAGQRVTFTVDAFPYQEFTGSTTQVRLSPTTTNNVVTYEVVVDAPNDGLKLKPGMTATCTIYTLDKPEVLTVPSQAVNFNPGNKTLNENDTVVWVLDQNNILVRREVKTGNSNNVHTEILSGLSEGEKVVIGQDAEETALQSLPDSGNESSPFLNQPPRRRGGAPGGGR
ncbi:efflux RND transporter periplasmic adaptor subunit [uncultured Proteiniphilum sp.]|uniref:efflux RND transporter periplasmic adaptor subunit n=1 Tax=uncultured Proteiniphilum sp. TaxID=497637 RepID=UPI00261F1438|nr:efflux RND transporter periplasmic adaptor subunit [uncultured Proteiniphilum sp.]